MERLITGRRSLYTVAPAYVPRTEKVEAGGPGVQGVQGHPGLEQDYTLGCRRPCLNGTKRGEKERGEGDKIEGRRVGRGAEPSDLN